MGLDWFGMGLDWLGMGLNWLGMRLNWLGIELDWLDMGLDWYLLVKQESGYTLDRSSEGKYYRCKYHEFSDIIVSITLMFKMKRCKYILTKKMNSNKI